MVHEPCIFQNGLDKRMTLPGIYSQNWLCNNPIFKKKKTQMDKFEQKGHKVKAKEHRQFHSNSKVISSSLQGGEEKKANLTFQPLIPYLLCGDNNTEDVVRINKFISQAL